MRVIMPSQHCRSPIKGLGSVLDSHNPSRSFGDSDPRLRLGASFDDVVVAWLVLRVMNANQDPRVSNGG